MTPEELAVHARRMAAVRARMADCGVEALVLSVGADLPWLCGYEAMPLERLTALVLPADAGATLVVPLLEAPRVDHAGWLFDLRPWAETEDPVAIVTSLLGTRRRIAISDRTWAVHLLALQNALPGAVWLPASAVCGPLRARKDATEVAALRAAAAAADRVAAALLSGEIPLVGRSEAEVSAEIGRRLLVAGHARVNFAIVASGPNAASPHHEPGPRVIGPGEAVVCDFGGTMGGYCSDITRTVWTSTPPPEEFVHVYEVVQNAQETAVAAALVGTPCEAVDTAARAVIEKAGFGANFWHRTGHGIGREEHEDPYIVAGNREPLAPGHVFSVEPGIYLPGRFGVRIEDIVVATAEGPERLNTVDRSLHVVEG